MRAEGVRPRIGTAARRSVRGGSENDTLSSSQTDRGRVPDCGPPWYLSPTLDHLSHPPGGKEAKLGPGTEVANTEFERGNHSPATGADITPLQGVTFPHEQSSVLRTEEDHSPPRQLAAGWGSGRAQIRTDHERHGTDIQTNGKAPGSGRGGDCREGRPSGLPGGSVEGKW